MIWITWLLMNDYIKNINISLGDNGCVALSCGFMCSVISKQRKRKGQYKLRK